MIVGLTKGRRDLAQHSQQRRSKLWSQSLRKTNIYLSLKGCNFQNNWNWQKLRWNIIHISTTRIKFVKWNCRHTLFYANCQIVLFKCILSTTLFCQRHKNDTFCLSNTLYQVNLYAWCKNVHFNKMSDPIAELLF